MSTALYVLLARRSLCLTFLPGSTCQQCISPGDLRTAVHKAPRTLHMEQHLGLPVSTISLGNENPLNIILGSLALNSEMGAAGGTLSPDEGLSWYMYHYKVSTVRLCAASTIARARCVRAHHSLPR
jgi:hypothetical protein